MTKQIYAKNDENKKFLSLNEVVINDTTTTTPVITGGMSALNGEEEERKKKEIHEHNRRIIERDYLRVGSDYYKKVKRPDAWGKMRTFVAPWKKDEIKQDFDKQYLTYVPKYDAFTSEPSYLKHRPTVGFLYNTFSPLDQQPEKGETKWSKIFMRQIFGDQIEAGYKLMQIYFIHPERYAPILVLVSKQRETGKTTFLDWLSMLFGDNVVMITPNQLKSDFNAGYAFSNIIGIEETRIEKEGIIQQLKAISTQRQIQVNQKYVNPVNIPFFGKFILTSNFVDTFARIEDDENRFFIRELAPPAPGTFNPNLKKDLQVEAPAFLHMLKELHDKKPIDFSISRTGFSNAELSNSNLIEVKENSKPWLYHDIKEHLMSLLDEHPEKNEVCFSAIDLKDAYYKNNHNVTLPFIRRILKDEFKLTPSSDKNGHPVRYWILAEGIEKTGRPYVVKRF